MTKIFKILKWIILILAAVFIIGFIYEQLSRLYFDKNYPPENEFVKVDGRKIHFSKKGYGPFTVVFESGIGVDYLHWQKIQNDVSKHYTTLSYDKAGILWSETANEVSLERYSKDLHQVLEKTNCPKPYILVGHSFAGITLRSFIKEHNDNIAGIIFVDVSHPEQLEKSSEKLKMSVSTPPQWILSFFNEIGVIRILYSNIPFTNSVAKEHWFNEHVKKYFYKVFSGLMQEVENDEKLMQQANEIDSFGKIPLTIITAKYPQGVEQIADKSLEKEYLSTHQILQQDLLNLSSKSKQIFAKKSGHYVTLQQPELIYKEIKDIIEKQDSLKNKILIKRH